jgi:hypothetical protein
MTVKRAFFYNFHLGNERKHIILAVSFMILNIRFVVNNQKAYIIALSFSGMVLWEQYGKF